MRTKSNSKKKTGNRWLDMSLEELREATKEFDKPMVNLPFKPLPPALKARWERTQAKLRGRGRPLVGEGAQRLSITVERGLLAEADSYAAERGITRAQLVAEGLRLAIKAGRRKAG